MQRSWKMFGRHFALGAALLSLASVSCSASSAATLSGVVRDTRGVAQMGALVEVLTANSAPVATAVTDLNGHYSFANLVPGRYRIRATAALFVPAYRYNLRLGIGMRATVNLTLNMLTDPAAWLPAKSRAPGEPKDDWTWTLRSEVNRPILRMLGDGDVVLVPPDHPNPEQPEGYRWRARNLLLSGDGFAAGGIHDVVTVNRLDQTAGTELIVRADLAAVSNASGSAPAEVDVAFQRKGFFGSGSRFVASYVSLPQMNCVGASGLKMIRTTTAEHMQLGDFADVDVGGTVYAIEMEGTSLTSRPFVKIAVHPGEVWAVQYKLATAPEVQGYDDLSSVAAELPAAAIEGGRLVVPGGTHQQFSVSRKLARGTLTASVYRDSLQQSAVSGTGAMTSMDVVSGVMLDSSSGEFRILGPGYGTTGVSVDLSEPITPGLWAVLQYASGAGLVTPTGIGNGVAGAEHSLHPEYSSAVTAEVKGTLRRSRTWIQTSYRWQPEHLVTMVDPYDDGSGQAYLSFYLRQEIRWGDRLPPGLEATLDVTNLLAQGYQPFLSADGHTLYLAQAARTVQGGLAFRF